MGVLNEKEAYRADILTIMKEAKTWQETKAMLLACTCWREADGYLAEGRLFGSTAKREQILKKLKNTA